MTGFHTNTHTGNNTDFTATQAAISHKLDDDFEVVEPTFGDAIVLGKDCPEWQNLLKQPATMMVGEVWGGRDPRNTKDGKWAPRTASWAMQVEHLSVHKASKHKEGEGVVLASTVEGARTAASVDTVYALGLDIDSGDSLDDALDRLEELGHAALVYTTYSDGKSGHDLKRDEVIKKLGLTLKTDENPTLEDVKTYLRQMPGSKRFKDSFIDAVTIADPRQRTSTGVKIVLDTPPLDKYRIIMPLAQPVDMDTLGPVQRAQQDAFERKIDGLGQLVGVQYDTACMDPSRLFYTPRHPKDSKDHAIYIVRGAPIRWDDVPDRRTLKEVNGSTKKVDTDDDLMKWLKKRWHSIKDRLMIADLLEHQCPDKVRDGEGTGKVTIECPFEHEHTEEGGTGTFAVNCLDKVSTDETPSFAIYCSHTCKDRYTKLDYLAQMIRAGWFDRELLEEGSDYLLPPGEEVTDQLPALIARAETLTNDSTPADLGALVWSTLEQADAIGEGGVEEVKEAAKTATGGRVSLFNKRWNDAAKKRADQIAAEDKARREALPTPDYVEADGATEESIYAAAEASKWLPSDFTYKGKWFFERKGENTYPVCRAFEVLYSADGMKGSARTNEIAIRYEHMNNAEGIVESTFRRGDMYKDVGSILGRLADEGLEFAPKASPDSILALMRAVRSPREAAYVEQSGWTADRAAYVSPTGGVVRGDDDKKLYVLDHSMRVSAAKTGTLEEAVAAAGAALRGKNAKRFLPGFLGGAVGCLADFLGEELAVVVANEGKAKQGKSTALKAGVAWFAVPDPSGLLISGNMTPTAMENMAARSSGAMFAPDESGASKATAEDDQAMILQYAGRAGRARGRGDGGMRDIRTWHGCMGLSTEHGLLNRLQSEQAADGRVDIKSGALSRVFTVNYDASIPLTRTDDREELEAYDVLAHGGAYGHLGPVFAAKLLDLGVTTVEGRVSAKVAEWGKDRKGAADRVVRTGALFGVAAQIAQEAGLLPADDDLPEGKGLQDLLLAALNETLDQRERYLDTETQSKDSLRREIIRALNASRIVYPEDKDSARGEIIGYWTVPKEKLHVHKLEERTYIIPADRLGMLVKTDVAALVEQLKAENGLVIPEKGKFARQGMWEYVPTEGNMKHIRIAGTWVHGEEPRGD